MATRPVPSFLIFRDKNGYWRWNFAAENGRVIAASSEAYVRREGCVEGIRLLKGAGDVPVLVRRPDVQAVPDPKSLDSVAPPPPEPDKNEIPADRAETLDLQLEQILH